MNRHLITTADERSWKFDRPVLFLGEWCRLYARKQVWGGLEAAVAEPYGLQIGQKERDLAYIDALFSQLMAELADALNAFHSTRHSLRYWHIVLGHWLRRYVTVTFNRYFTLEKALRKYDISGTTVFDFSQYSLATTDSLAFVWASNDSVWNHVLYGKIIEFWGDPKTEVDSSALRGISGFALERHYKPAKSYIAKQVIRNVANFILPRLRKKRDAFIINSYLPPVEEVKLQVSLGQCPQLWRSPALRDFAPVPETRRGFCVDADNHAGFEKFARTQLSDIIPTCYLEGYDQLVQQVKSLPWPTEPRFILTANNFDTDEVFKAWTGSMMEQGIPYFVGQHGNNYGTLLGSPSWPELVTCDKFFTWGWANRSSRNIPAFVFNLAGRKPQYAVLDGRLLLIENHQPHLLGPEDSYHEYAIYQEEQFRFVDALPAPIQEKLTVRLHSAYRYFCWSDEQRWRDRSPHTQIETGAADLRKLIARSRLVVHSYDSTGILETLALNVPTMCFWQGGLDHLLPRAKPYYELLRNAGILADTPEHAAELIASRWDNVHEWWRSTKVQDTRKSFCEQYARTAKKPVLTMKRLLTAHPNKGNRRIGTND